MAGSHPHAPPRPPASARGGKSAKRKVVVVVARKLAVLLHMLWQPDVNFDPFYGIKPKTT